MKKATYVVLAALVVLVGYFLAWPTGADPVAWQPAPMPALDGVFAPNTYLAGVERVDLPEGEGPEDVAVDAEGRMVAGLVDGRLVRLAPDGTGFEVLADTEGRPLGLDYGPDGTLYVADAKQGLLAVDATGAVRVLAIEADGVPFGFADDVDVGPDGRVYFSDASHKFGIEDYTLDIVESRPSGRLLAYDPATGETRTLLDDLHFANGVAVSPDGAFVLVNETSRYRVRRYWLTGEKAGTDEVFADNLPFFNDGISTDPAGGRFWVAMISPRDPVVDRLAPHPFVRKMLLRLPKALRPAPKRYAHVVALDEAGRVVYSLQDAKAERIALISSVERYGDRLYFGSLTEPALGHIAVPR